MMYMPSIFGENLVDDFFNDDFFRTPAQRPAVMRTDVRQKDGQYELDVELPGYKKEDVSLELDNGYLKIHAGSTKENDEKDSDGKLIRQERYTGSAERSFYVGDQITENDIHAKFENGILKISLPDEETRAKVPEKKTIAIEG